MDGTPAAVVQSVEPDALRLAAYRAALNRHYWAHEYAPDFASLQRGRESLAALTHEQEVLDPTFAIWNSHAPFGFRKRMEHL